MPRPALHFCSGVNTLIAEVAAAIGTTRRLELKPGWRVPTNTWVAIIGESGTAKSPAFALAMKPFHRRQCEGFEKHAEAMQVYDAKLALWDASQSNKKKSQGMTAGQTEKPIPPPCERYLVGDCTVEALAKLLGDNTARFIIRHR